MILIIVSLFHTMIDLKKLDYKELQLDSFKFIFSGERDEVLNSSTFTVGTSSGIEGIVIVI